MTTNLGFRTSFSIVVITYAFPLHISSMSSWFFIINVCETTQARRCNISFQVGSRIFSQLLLPFMGFPILHQKIRNNRESIVTNLANSLKALLQWWGQTLSTEDWWGQTLSADQTCAVCCSWKQGKFFTDVCVTLKSKAVQCEFAAIGKDRAAKPNPPSKL